MGDDSQIRPGEDSLAQSPAADDEIPF
jgi:hypothetical protein